MAGCRGLFAPFSGELPVSEKAGKGSIDPEEAARLAAEKRVQKALYRFWRGQSARLRRVLNEKRDDLEAAQAERRANQASKAGFDVALDWGEETGKLQAEIGELFTDLFDAVLLAVCDPIKKMGINLSWEVFDSAAAEIAQYYKYDFLKDITESTRDQLGKTISRWIESDGDFGDLVGKVRQLVPTKSYPGLRDRAQLIAATEVTRVYSQARSASFSAAGLKRWRWRGGNDDLVCNFCRPLIMANDGEGAIGTIEGGFIHPVSGEKVSAAPAHPACRCWEVADTTELETLAKGAPE